MRVVTLGNVGRLGSESETLPSSQATLSLLRGEPGAIWKVVGSALLRACLVAPGVVLAAYLAGARGKRLGYATAAGSALASTGISLFLLGHYWAQERRRALPSTTMPTALPAGAEPTTGPELAVDASVVADSTENISA